VQPRARVGICHPRSKDSQPCDRLNAQLRHVHVTIGDACMAPNKQHMTGGVPRLLGGWVTLAFPHVYYRQHGCFSSGGGLEPNTAFFDGLPLKKQRASEHA